MYYRWKKKKKKKKKKKRLRRVIASRNAFKLEQRGSRKSVKSLTKHVEGWSRSVSLCLERFGKRSPEWKWREVSTSFHNETKCARQIHYRLRQIFHPKRFRQLILSSSMGIDTSNRMCRFGNNLSFLRQPCSVDFVSHC